MNYFHLFAIPGVLVFYLHAVNCRDLLKSSGDNFEEVFNNERGGRVKRNMLRYRRMLWSNGDIPYVLANSIKSRPSYVKVIKQGMAEWEKHTCVRFKERTNEISYAYFFHGKGCYARVGAAPRGQTIVSLGPRCNDFGVAVHELGHVIGFFHEQNRQDRNKYVQILWNNMPDKAKRQFTRTKPLWSTTLGFPYDYKSVMHYGKYHHSKNGRPTIRIRDPSVKRLGGRHLSPIDIMQANVLYNCLAYPEFPKDFSWQSRVPRGQRCLRVYEPRDPDWRTKYLCYPASKNDLGLKWSHRGIHWGQICSRIQLRNKPSSRSWRNNFLCYPRNSIYRFYWFADRPISGMGCLKVADEVKRRTYYLCAKKKSGVKLRVHGRWTQWSPWLPCSAKCGGGVHVSYRNCTTPQNGGKICVGPKTRTKQCNPQACPPWPFWTSEFRLGRYSSKPSRMNCITIFKEERFRLCWAKHRRDLNPRITDSGNVPGMRCTNFSGPLDSKGSWKNNKTLCLPNNTPYSFQISDAGRKAKMKCLPFGGTLKGRENSYLCATTRFECPSYWIPYRQGERLFCYRKLDFPLTWPAAQKHCQTLGANLVSITSRKEDQFIREVASGIHRWIGFNDRRREGRMEWADKSPVNYTNWSKGDPNNGGYRKNEDCAMLNHNKGHWNDWPCNTKFYSLCKITAG